MHNTILLKHMNIHTCKRKYILHMTASDQKYNKTHFSDHLMFTNVLTQLQENLTMLSIYHNNIIKEI